jgi:hypothetical protein
VQLGPRTIGKHGTLLTKKDMVLKSDEPVCFLATTWHTELWRANSQWQKRTPQLWQNFIPEKAVAAAQ